MEGLKYPTRADFAWSQYTHEVGEGMNVRFIEVMDLNGGYLKALESRDDLDPTCENITIAFPDGSAIIVLKTPTEYLKVGELYDGLLRKSYPFPDYVREREVKFRKYKKEKPPIKRWKISLWPPSIEIERAYR